MTSSLGISPPAVTVKDVFNAARSGNIQTIQQFLELDNGNIDIVDAQGNSLLHWASYTKHYPVVRYLLLKGIDVNIANATEMQTALHWAIAAGSAKIVTLMVASNVKLNHTDFRGYGALHVAAQNNHLDLVHYLVLKGVGIDVPDKEGNTPFHWACIKGDLGIVRYLYSAGANIEQIGSKGYTALHWAVGLNHSEIAKFLLRKHPQLLQVRDHQGRTPKDIAKEKNEHSIMRVIKTAETEMELAKYSLSPYGKSLAGFFVPFIFYVILISCLTSIGFWLTAAIEGIFVGAVRIYRASLLPHHDDTNTLILGIYYSSFMVSVAGYWYKIGQFAMAEHPVTNVIFLIVAFGTLFLHLKLIYSDPGFVDNSDPHADAQGWLNDIENERDVKLCTTCRTRRPIRAKHCSQTNRCVVRFDHYCVWIGTTVGIRNHFQFLVMLAGTIGCHAFGASHFFQAFNLSSKMTIGQIGDALASDVFLLFLLIFQVLNGIWEFHLWLTQFLLILQNLTVNEQMHMRHYTHFWRNGQFYNPFDCGSRMANLRDWWSPQLDYFKLFYLPRSVKDDALRAGGDAGSDDEESHAHHHHHV